MGKSASDVIAGGASVIIGGDDSLYNKVIDNADRRLRAFGQSAIALGAKIGGIGTGLGLGLLGAVKSFAATGQALNAVAVRTGDTAQNISELGYAATATGASLGSLESGLTSMSDVIYKATKGEGEAVATLQKLGLSAAALKGKLPTQQFEMFATALQGVTDPSQRKDLMQAVFGGSAGDLSPLLNEGAAGIAKLRKEAEALGVTMSNRDAAAAAKLTQAFHGLYQSVGAIVTKFGSALAPAIVPIIQYVTKAAAGIAKWIDANRAVGPQAAVIVAGLTALGAGFAAVGAAAFIMGPTIKLAFGIASIAAYAFSAALAVLNTAVAVASAAVKVFAVGCQLLAMGFRIAASTTITFTIAQTALGIAVKITAAMLGAMVFVAKTVALQIAAMTVISTAAALGYKSLAGALSTCWVVMKVGKSAILALTAAQGVMTGTTAALTTAQTALGIAVAAVTTPIGLAVAAIAGLLLVGAPLAYAFLNWTDAGKAFSEGVSKAFSGIKEYVLGALGGISNYVAGLPNALIGYMGAVGDQFAGVWEEIVSVGRAAFESAKQVFLDLLGTAQTTFAGISDAVKAGNIQLAMDILWAGWNVAFAKGCDALKNSWDSTWIYAEGVLDVAMTSMKAIWDVGLNYMVGAFDKFSLGIRNTMQDISGSWAEWIASTGIFGEVDAESMKEEQRAQYEQINRGAQEREDARNNNIADAGGDAAARKRAEERQSRQDEIKNRTSDPKIAKLEAELQALRDQAAAEANGAALPDKMLKEGQQRTQDEAARGNYGQGVEANARGSAGAASSIAKAVNAQSTVPQQQLTLTKQQLKEAEKQTRFMAQIAQQAAITIVEES